MAYSVNQLAKVSGVSARTLRYYDQIDLLKPRRSDSNDYRFYEAAEVDRLQQILFYRALGVSLEEVRNILDAPGFDRGRALEGHLTNLRQEKRRLEGLIETVNGTLRAMRGEGDMSDQEKFACFQKRRVEENEKRYGKEMRQKYGDASIEASNAKLLGMNQSQWEEGESLRQEAEELFRQALAEKNPVGETARQACEVHGRWLQLFWKEGQYSRMAHRNMGEMYAGDERFAAYYEEHVGHGGAAFIRDALAAWVE